MAPPLRELMVYMETQWITSTVFPVNSWSVFQRSFRTNNDVEGWHNRINQNVHGAGLNMYELILRLHHEALDVVLTCQLVEEEVLKRMQRTKYRHCHEKIMELLEAFEARAITIVKKLLKRCAYINGPWIDNEHFVCIILLIFWHLLIWWHIIHENYKNNWVVKFTIYRQSTSPMINNHAQVGKTTE